jgi:Uri superfamily endonuclease
MKGAYCLVLAFPRSMTIEIGSLGKLTFEKGFYIYIGSAMNGIENRVERHLRKDKKIHWHIDYLTASGVVKIHKVYIKESSKREECLVAREVSSHGLPIEGFGSSDCKCLSHLYRVKDFGFLEGFMTPFEK